MIGCPSELVLLALLAVGGASAIEPVAGPLEPAWTWHMQPGIEWVAAVGADDVAALLVAGRDARLQLLDAVSGEVCWAEPLVTGRGARLAADERRNAFHEAVYCFDRAAIYDLNPRSSRPLRWQFGDRTGGPDPFDGDPEVLKHWRAVAATDRGPLALDSDGRLVLLVADTGAACWRHELGRPGVVRLHAREHTAVVLWRAHGHVRAALVNLASELPTAFVRDLGDLWPLWSDLTEHELITVAPACVVVWPLDGSAPRRFATGIDRPRARTIALRREPPLLVFGDGPRLLAYDLSTGQRCWPKADERDAGTDVQAVSIVAGRVLVTYAAGALVRDAGSGRVLASCPLLQQPAELIAAGVTAGRLCTLDRDPRAKDALLRLSVAPLAAERPAETAPVPALPRQFRLPAASDVRQVIWVAGCVVVVEPNRLRAYRLP